MIHMNKVKKISTFLLSFLIIIICIEVYFRLTGISLPSYVYDDNVVGRTHDPGHKIFLVQAEGFCIDEVNALGYIGTEYPKKKSTNTIRVALLGSSYIEGVQVFRRNRFSTKLEKQLTNKLDKKVEVVNFAIGGDDFRGMYVRYQKLVKQFNPDYVLFMIQPQALYKAKTIPSPELILVNDSLEINYNYLNTSETQVRQKFKFLRKFAIGNMIKEAYEAYYIGRLPAILFDKLYSPPVKKSENKKTTDMYKFFDIDIKIIEMLNNDNNNSNITNIIVPIDELPSNYSSYLDSLNFPVVNIYSELQKYEPKELLYWKASGIMGHWNNYAHNIIGELVSTKLAEFIKKSKSNHKVSSENN